MCGRYALGLVSHVNSPSVLMTTDQAQRPSQIRAYFEDEDMPVYDAPEDDAEDAPRQSYNFAPGYHGIVYRADVPDWGAGPRSYKKADIESDGMEETEVQDEPDDETIEQVEDKDVRYRLQSMKWGRSLPRVHPKPFILTLPLGLIPFWTKRNPDYTNMLKTINCRDDSLLEPRGMWNTMKQKKRCIVVAQGFYEWLKKPNNKEKIPHFTKRADGKLLCMAGLWDCVQYAESPEKLYTYTTDSNKQLKFLHDRMPVILDNGSDAMRTWLDPKRHIWSKELQGLLHPYQGQLECYPVVKDVGKVGNNSPTFIVPVDSKENKNNIANFFANAKPIKSKTVTTPRSKIESKISVKKEDEPATMKEVIPKEENGEDENILAGQTVEQSETVDHSSTEDNAPVLVPKSDHDNKRHLEETPEMKEEPSKKAAKMTGSPVKKTASRMKGRNTRSATSNGTLSPTTSTKVEKDKGNQRITNFFSK